MKNILLSLIAIYLFVSSCKKTETDDNYPTIYPLPYLPVYPGSEWKYLDNHGDTVIYKTENNYVLHSYASSELYGAETKPAYVPVWIEMPVYGYSTPVLSSYSLYPYYYYQTKILSVDLGDQFAYSYDHGYYGWKTTTLLDTSITVNNLFFEKVIVITDSSGYGNGQSERISGYEYYAKDVGLIKLEAVDSTVHQVLGIINYNINH